MGTNAENFNPDAVFAQSMSAFQRKDFETAIKLSEQLREFSHNAPPAMVWGVRLRLESQRWAEAIEIGEKGAGASPGLIGLVGHAYEALGDLDNAQKCFERASREQPTNAGWFYHNASVLSRQFRDFESMEALQTAVQLAPSNDASALLILAANQLSFGSPEKALATAEDALKLNPFVAGAHALAARSLIAKGDIDGADKRWAIARRAESKDRSLPLQRAIALVRQGEFDRGIEALEEILDVQPNFVPALVQIATAKKLTEEDRPMIERMEQILKEPRITDEDRIALNYAIGKSYDNLKKYEVAMRHFDAANTIQYRAIEESGGFDREGYAANMTLRTKVYEQELTEKLAKAGNPSESPIFVLGVIRSGTTLAEQILAAHPDVAGAGELSYWINTDLRLMDYSTQQLNIDTLRAAAGPYLRLIQGYAKDGATRVVDKQPGNLILAGALHIAFPNARIIHMRRHPVDTAVSIWTTHVRTSTRFVNHKGNIAYAFGEHDRLLRHWREVIAPNRFLEVSYEELVDDRERVTRQLLEFCGLDWNEACLSPERNRKQVITPSLWQVRQPVYRTSIARWKNYEPWLGEFAQMLAPTDR